MKTQVCPKCGTPVQSANAHGVTFVHESGVVTYEGRTCRLSPTEVDILEHLLDAWPGGIQRDHLWSSIYAERNDEETPGSKTLNVFLSKMRRVFEAAGLAIYIRSRRGKFERSEFYLVLGSAEEKQTAEVA